MGRIYLLHGVIALPMEAALRPRLRLSAAPFISLAALTAAVQLSFVLIEKPLQALTREVC